MARIPDYWFLERSVDSLGMARFTNENSLWYETHDEIAAGLRDGRRRARLLAAVCKVMPDCLTARQQLCLAEHYFEGKSYRRIGQEQGLHFTTVGQHVTAAVRRLRKVLCD